MILLRSIAPVAILFATFSVQAEDATKYDLKYKFKSGEVVRSEVVHKATVETTIKGTSQTAETRTTSVKLWKVGDVKPDGSVTFTHSVESIDMWQKMQGRQEQRYNSKSDKKPPQGYETVAKQVGVPLTVVSMDTRGKVSKRQEMLKQPNANPTQITLPLPEEPVEIGHTWNTPSSVTLQSAGGAVKQVDLREVYTLKGVSAGVASIEVETEILTPISDPALEAQMIQRMTSGTVKFDIDAGRVISQVTDLDRRVIGFSGPASSMHYLTRVEEKLLAATPQSASKSPAKTATKAPPKTATKAAPKTASKAPKSASKTPPKTSKAPPKSASKLRR